MAAEKISIALDQPPASAGGAGGLAVPGAGDTRPQPAFTSAPASRPGAKPTVCIVLGMAGSGKTTLMQRLNAHVHQKKWPSYLMNLDPAVAEVPFGAHIDIRDTVKYREVMKQYGLGPNGGIMTALNLFATRFDQVMDLLEKKQKAVQLDQQAARKEAKKKQEEREKLNVCQPCSVTAEEAAAPAGEGKDAAGRGGGGAGADGKGEGGKEESEGADGLKYVLMDTPGQIEVFTWSASGAIITETLASTYPTVLVYVVDIARTANPTTFMSNMLYACSILYKLQLPFVLCFNKVDVMSHETALEWMSDFESFQEALDAKDDGSYMDSFVRSMSLVLDEFYSNLRAVGVSAATGMGIDGLFREIDAAAVEYEAEYLPALKARIEAKQAREAKASLARLKKDLATTKASGKAGDASGTAAGGGAVSVAAARGADDDDDDEDAYDDEDGAEEGASGGGVLGAAARR
eukprot:g3400.t1